MHNARFRPPISWIPITFGDQNHPMRRPHPLDSRAVGRTISFERGENIVPCCGVYLERGKRRSHAIVQACQERAQWSIPYRMLFAGRLIRHGDISPTQLLFPEAIELRLKTCKTILLSI